MSSTAPLDARLREAILEKPDVILEDSSLMSALVAANDRAMGANVVDLRGIAMARLEARLDRLEDTHRSVIAAAYDNLTGTNQVHRAVLALIEPQNFPEFLLALSGPVSEALEIQNLVLVLESDDSASAAGLAAASSVIKIQPRGFVAHYLGQSSTAHPVSLRQVEEGDAEIHGDQAGWIRSEALMSLDLGTGRLPGLLVFGSEEPHQFSPQHGTDLLTFFAGTFERCLRNWLA
ncbi:DUF484 family protein [Epibacterium sp. SM1969]|uniref:DUF484 family protein n=1 Tax=Tritonibacter aquimaris TaxID=2663379 RepID=A0A844AYP0_9RHOB|nr:DUF484 family protein [Tritonibacter aquimaris]MQY43061.1 DUF484 family protein [Tritonibacter aquimaris]